MIDDDYAEVNLTPSVKSLELKFNLRVGSPTDNDSYGEESFESEFQSSPSKKDSSSTKALKADSSKASPKRQKTPKSPRVGLMEKLAKAESERYEDDDDFSFSGDELEEGNNKNLKQNQGQEQSVEEEGQENFGDMNLDDFLQRFGDGDNEDTGGEPKKEDPSLRPLEGMSPPANADSRDLINSMKLNSPSASAGMSDGNGGFTTSPLSLEAQTQRLKDAISAEESNAAKVDALLRKLNVKQRVADVDEIEPRVPYPVMHDSTSHIANNYKHPKHETKFEAMSKLPLFDKYNTGVKKHHDSESSGPTEHSTRDSNLLAAQVASLKADLKRRDDRLGRIVEHDALITSKCESLTREVAFLKQGLHDAQLECGAQTKRAENALKVKKYKKKAGKTTEVLENEIKVLTESNERLVGRESALLEAIDQLSGQNEELMRQLKEAMDKETRYGQLIHSLTSQQHDSGVCGSNNSSPEKGMNESKSTSHIGGKKKKRRDRAITTGSAEMEQASAAGSHRITVDKGKLPKLNEKLYRHNHTRAFHCFN